MAEKNGNGIKLKFSAPQIITIVILIVTLAVTLASKADKHKVQENCTELKLIKQRTEMQYKTIIEKLEKIENKIEENGHKGG